MHLLVYVLLAAAAGALVPVQTGANAELARRLGHPVLAALVNFTVGAVALAAATLAVTRPAGAVSRALGAPWWAWIGGLLGATFVVVAVVVIRHVGATAQLAAMLAGWMIGALLVDRLGLLNLPVREL